MPLPLIPLALGLVSEFAPGLVRHFAGDKAGEVAEKVVGIAGALTGESEPDAMAAALRGNPELAAQFRQQSVDLELGLATLEIEDRRDARARDLAMRQAGQENRRADLMIVGDVVGLLACLTAMVAITVLGVKGDVPPALLAMNGPIGTLAGFFGAGLRDAHQFEFGSSRGSKQKDSVLAGFAGLTRTAPSGRYGAP